MRISTVFIVAAVISFESAPAHACGGMVTVSTSAAQMAGQRVFISNADGNTEMVVQIDVPATDQDYGILLPVPADPTIDGVPIDSDELDELDDATRVTIHETVFTDTAGGGGCGCGDTADLGGRMSEPTPVTVSNPVDVGPVTAISITADTGDAITTWLNDNGFVIPTEHQAVVDSYAGPGQYFVAFKRSDGAPMGEATSVGVHLSMSGEHASYALRIAQLGAAPELAVIVFVASEGGVGPSAPFVGVTLDELDPLIIQRSGYASAVSDAIVDRDNRAFVVEGVHARDDLVTREALGPQLSALTVPGQQITRMTAVFDTTQLAQDADLAGPPPPGVTNEIYLSAPPEIPGGRPTLPGGPALPLLASIAWMLTRARRRPSLRRERTRHAVVAFATTCPRISAAG